MYAIDQHEWVVGGECAEIVRVSCQDDSSASKDCFGDNQSIHGHVGSFYRYRRQKTPCCAGSFLRHRCNLNSLEDAVDLRVSRSPARRFSDDDSGNDNKIVPPDRPFYKLPYCRVLPSEGNNGPTIED